MHRPQFRERCGVARRAIAVGGTCTGEHGAGQKKMAYMEEEHGPAALDLMRRVKASFDPQNLFNPGKVFFA
jgi:D-lactate dehydrogenase (cytochrome)